MPTTKEIAPTISFKSKLYTIGTWTILRLPEEESAKLHSRGQVMVEGLLNGTTIRTPLEPDGQFGHWFRIDETLQKSAHVKSGDTVEIEITPTKNWPEPEISADFQNAISASKKASDLWPRITPMARWEWIRWIRATGRDETRERRIAVGISKMESGERRPCCWNRNLCTEPSVSKNGILLNPN